MSTPRVSRFIETIRVGALAGIAGGIAEIGWIVLYGMVTGTPTGLVARGVVGSVIPPLAASPWAAWLGIFIHLVLAIALGLGLALALRSVSRFGNAGRSQFVFVMLAVVAVWVINFFFVLPRINPEFIALLPSSVTLLSKLLFGLSAATVFCARRTRPVRIPAN
jgi:hypothetical protein